MHLSAAYAGDTLDVDLNVANRDDVVEVRDDEDLSELAIKLAKLLEQDAPTIKVLAAEDLVEDDQTGVGAALARERARERQSQAEVGEVLLAAREALQRPVGAVGEQMQARVLVEPHVRVTAGA